MTKTNTIQVLDEDPPTRAGRAPPPPPDHAGSISVKNGTKQLPYSLDATWNKESYLMKFWTMYGM